VTDLMEVLQNGDEDIRKQALVVTQNLMGHLKKAEASSVGVQLSEKLLPLFDEVRLMGQPEPRRWALGKGSCPSAQPCEQRSNQPILLCFLPWAPVGWLPGCAAQASFSLASAATDLSVPQLHCGARPDVLPRPQGKGLRLSQWGMAEKHC